VDVYRTPDERFAGLPGYGFEPGYVEQDGLRMHYVEEGSGAPVLLLHGEPTWAFLYRKLILPISHVARVVAPDYFGFGRSDKPTRLEDYSYDFHYGSIERLAHELDLRDATIVVQDAANAKNIIIYEPGTQPPQPGPLKPGTPNKVPVK